MTQNKKTNQIYFSHVTWGHEVAIVTLTSTFKKTFKKTALAQQIHNDFKNLLNEMRFFNVVLVKLYNFFLPFSMTFPSVKIWSSIFQITHLHVPGCTGASSFSFFFLTVVHFSGSFIASDRQLKSAEHTLAARQRCAAP